MYIVSGAAAIPVTRWLFYGIGCLKRTAGNKNTTGNTCKEGLTVSRFSKFISYGFYDYYYYFFFSFSLSHFSI